MEWNIASIQIQVNYYLQQRDYVWAAYACLPDLLSVSNTAQNAMNGLQ